MRFTSMRDANNFYVYYIDRLREQGDDYALRGMAELARRDLFFLLTFVLKREDAANEFVFARCQEVQNGPDGYLDLWARGHYKSTIITFAKSIQDIVRDPETTIGIFSHTRPIAKGFLRQIKNELEGNRLLKKMYPEILYDDPKRQAPKWSEDEGITVKRRGNAKEATVEAWGLVDGQPTGKHYDLLVYDDVVTRESVTSPAMIAKVTEAVQLSFNLAAAGGRRRFIGTRYHYNDTYKALIEAGVVKARVHAATEDGKATGEPVLLSASELAEKRKLMGPYVFGCQMLQDPKADQAQGFRRAWLRFWTPGNYAGMNLYLVCDPASSKKRGGDYTVFYVVGLAADRNYYVVDMVRDRLNLTERAATLFDLHRRYAPQAVGYEQYGMQADIEHFKDKMARENYRFHITPLSGRVAKEDRIRGLIPLFEQGRVYLPKRLTRSDYAGRPRDLIKDFINDEYLAFPVAAHDDMLDALARVIDQDFPARFPARRKQTIDWQGVYLR